MDNSTLYCYANSFEINSKLNSAFFKNTNVLVLDVDV